jgi:hypothetical protein
MMMYAAPKDTFAILAIFDNWFNFLFGYGANLADLFVYDYYMIQDTPFGLKDRYDSVSPMESAVTPTSGILQIFIGGGLVGALLFLYFLYIKLKRCSKLTIVSVMSILASTVAGSSLIFTIGLFFIAVIINNDRKLC